MYEAVNHVRKRSPNHTPITPISKKLSFFLYSGTSDTGESENIAFLFWTLWGSILLDILIQCYTLHVLVEKTVMPEWGQGWSSRCDSSFNGYISKM